MNKLSDFATLALAQAHPVVTDTKQVGSGQARGYLVSTNDLWKTLKVIQADMSHGLFSLADAIITTASDAQSYFGMDITKADGVANRAGLATLVTYGIMTQPEADGFIAKTISTTYPFLNTTQPEFDLAVNNEILNVPVDAHTVVYGETEMDYCIKLPNKDFTVFAVFDNPVPIDCNVDVFVWEQPIEAVPHAKTFKTNVLRVNSGEANAGDKITKDYKRKIKFSATCNKNFPFTLYIKW